MCVYVYIYNCWIILDDYGWFKAWTSSNILDHLKGMWLIRRGCAGPLELIPRGSIRNVILAVPLYNSTAIYEIYINISHMYGTLSDKNRGQVKEINGESSSSPVDHIFRQTYPSQPLVGSIWPARASNSSSEAGSGLAWVGRTHHSVYWFQENIRKQHLFNDLKHCFPWFSSEFSFQTCLWNDGGK